MAVIVTTTGKIIRACPHTGTVVVGMSAVARGVSKMKQEDGKQTS